jgi:hypothetical protein
MTSKTWNLLAAAGLMAISAPVALAPNEAKACFDHKTVMLWCFCVEGANKEWEDCRPEDVGSMQVKCHSTEKCKDGGQCELMPFCPVPPPTCDPNIASCY